jgi:hypothetical protein
MKWFTKWYVRRERRRYFKWLKKMREKHVVFEKPIGDPRDWQGEFRRSQQK